MNINKINNTQSFKGLAIVTLNANKPEDKKVIFQNFDNSILDVVTTSDDFDFQEKELSPKSKGVLENLLSKIVVDLKGVDGFHNNSFMDKFTVFNSETGDSVSFYTERTRGYDSLKQIMEYPDTVLFNFKN